MLRFHKEGKTSIVLILSFSAALLILSAVLVPASLWYLKVVLNIVAIFFAYFILQFFRNPIRQIAKADDSIIYAPADGKIVVIEEVMENEFLKEKCIQVSIFMSPMNVHVNRNPISGIVKYSKYHAGKYLMAWNPKASTENERTTVVYERTDGQRILMRQIAGFLARRIVNYLKIDDVVTQGEDMGFIKLGSRVDLFLPLGTDIKVKIDDMVQGNLTTIAHLKMAK